MSVDTKQTGITNIDIAIEGGTFAAQLFRVKFDDQHWTYVSTHHEEIAKFHDSPICVESTIYSFRGKRILFYEPVSLIVNWKKVEEWLKETVKPREHYRAEQIYGPSFNNLFGKVEAA